MRRMTILSTASTVNIKAMISIKAPTPGLLPTTVSPLIQPLGRRRHTINTQYTKTKGDTLYFVNKYIKADNDTCTDN